MKMTQMMVLSNNDTSYNTLFSLLLVLYVAKINVFDEFLLAVTEQISFNFTREIWCYVGLAPPGDVPHQPVLYKFVNH